MYQSWHAVRFSSFPEERTGLPDSRNPVDEENASNRHNAVDSEAVYLRTRQIGFRQYPNPVYHPPHTTFPFL